MVGISINSVWGFIVSIFGRKPKSTSRYGNYAPRPVSNPMFTKKRVATGTAGLFAASLVVAIPFLEEREGLSLKAYQDSVGVWTICHGETLGVVPGMEKSLDYCRKRTEERALQFMKNVHGMLKVEVPATTLAAHTSFAYNIGVGGYKRSRTLKLTNQGDLIGGCRAMMGWYKAGGRDCRIRSNNCHGVITRRRDEVALCLEGVNLDDTNNGNAAAYYPGARILAHHIEMRPR